MHSVECAASSCYYLLVLVLLFELLLIIETCKVCVYQLGPYHVSYQGRTCSCCTTNADNKN